MAEIRRDALTDNSGLSTAALAHADEQQTYDEQQMDGRDRNLGADTRMDADRQKTNGADVRIALFSPDETKNLRGQWDSIQVGFVDEPRQAVERADALVAGAMKRLAEIFADERARLEGQWDRGDSVSTEDLRVALQRYRAFFGRLLAV